MPPIVPIAADLLIALCLVLALVIKPDRKPGRLLPALPLVGVGLLLAFVFREDSYRGNGISRWDAYRSPGGALEPMFYATVVSMTVAAGLMTLAVVQQRRRLLQASAAGAALVAVLLGIPTVIGFSAN